MSDADAPIRRILVAHDFSETAERALAFALDLAGKLHASVTLMHAYEVPTYGLPESPFAVPELHDEIERASRDALAAVARRARRPGLEVATVLRHGPAWSEITALAQEGRFDLVVIGTHGRRGVARVLLGSVAEKVVRTAPCAVVTVHGPGREK